ncbi:MAG: recombinase family protein [Planctomycetaceae bacterium]
MSGLQEQGESGLGLEGQKAVVVGFAQQNRGDIVRESVEVESGRNSDRQELARALSHAKRAKATLVVAKLDASANEPSPRWRPRKLAERNSDRLGRVTGRAANISAKRGF